MKYQFKKIPIEQQVNIYGGSVLAVVTAVAPIVFAGISTIANVVKMFMTSSGETKVGNNSIKWNDNNQKPESITQFKTIYLSY
ncbi:hypothetical protein KQ874_01035 [Mycoplasma sp. ES3157-GEN-MYC]|uniref:Uncharacterized protein n=1 Tax=Mycoplasma miroungigenitalium TaxID=754515 RepID=A0A6M4J8Y8_9MOLU|nr:hypothetical protein [Mycoplasma miroungigenitalium]MBU4690281.1 hypothetical protein [Mycoplasma miroungigenitalium]MBU4691548.1 hypothetical protein [Mycoplasma miroungigenitalium]QJR43380.1 hypothetical protein HLA87_01025 [Mycoplasma miroungigenitalium]